MLVPCGSVLVPCGSVVVAPGLQGTGSIVVAHRLSSSTARGIFLDQGLNLSVDSLPLSYQGSPGICF